MIHAPAYRTLVLVSSAASIAQAGGGSQQDLLHYLMWIGLAVALIVLAGAGVMMLRKRMFGPESRIDSAGSMFDELRRLHREGLMSQEEYDVARKKLATRASEAMDRRAAQRAQDKPGHRGHTPRK